MSSIWGNKLKISIFGESHGSGIGVVIDGFPAGYKIDFEYINEQMKRRAPGKNKLQTSRRETDVPQIISGVFNGTTTGAPICAIVYNEDKKSSDYDRIKETPRPGHSDYPAYVKYNGYNDYRGGGHFSGRLTAPIVFAGALCKSYLYDKYNILIGCHIKSIGPIKDDCISDEYYNCINNIEDKQNCDSNKGECSKKDFVDLESLYNELRKKDFPTINDDLANKMKNEIENARVLGDSIGGEIEAFILNMPAGIGEPMFDSIESRVAHMMFSIPGIKGIEFGDGFKLASMNGSQANDAYAVFDGRVLAKSNHNGGTTGGLTNGMPIVYTVAVKPTSSIAIEQDTVNIKTMTNDKITVIGRHDPCIVQRAVPVIECASAIVILDFLL